MTIVAFSKNDKYIISGSSDNSIKIWERETGSEIKTLIGHSGGVTSIAVSKDEKYIISGSYDKFIIIWELETGIKI